MPGNMQITFPAKHRVPKHRRAGSGNATLPTRCARTILHHPHLMLRCQGSRSQQKQNSSAHLMRLFSWGMVMGTLGGSSSRPGTNASSASEASIMCTGEGEGCVGRGWVGGCACRGMRCVLGCVWGGGCGGGRWWYVDTAQGMHALAVCRLAYMRVWSPRHASHVQLNKQAAASPAGQPLLLSLAAMVPQDLGEHICMLHAAIHVQQNVPHSCPGAMAGSVCCPAPHPGLH